MEEKLNLDKLKLLIKNGIKAIPKDEHAKEAIIVVGDTGVGKSTIMNFLAGNRLVVKSEGLKPKLITVGSSVIKIGHEKYSETSIPTRVMIENIAFYDCPGFRDNKGEEYEISNSFFVQELLDIYEKVKIVLMIDESHISEARVDKLPKLTKNLLRSFKSFHDIQQGVILIINRTDPELSIQDYNKEIKKLLSLKNEKGFFFGDEEQSFLNYLADNNRIKIFQSPQKKDNGNYFEGSQYEKDIMPSIRSSDFVKSRHISNIVSESAKIAIRDYIDDVTIKSNTEVEKISEKIGEHIVNNFNSAGKVIPKLLEIKESVILLAEEIRTCEGPNILNILKREIPNYNFINFENDFDSIMFFKGIYDKTSVFFSNVINKTYSELSIVLNRLDSKILKYQKEEEDELEHQRMLLKRKEIENKRERERLATLMQIKKMKEVRDRIERNKMGNCSILESMCETLNQMSNLEHEFVNLKSNACKLELVNHTLKEEYKNFDENHLRSMRLI